MISPPISTAALARRAETMLDLAEFVGVDLDAMWIASRRLAEHEAAYDRAPELSTRKELKVLMADDIAILAEAYKMLAWVVERMPSV
jgi:hypothetical protein